MHRRAERPGAGARARPAGGLRAAPVIAILGWGALAFGAVYPWAYRPLAAAAAVAGIAGLAGASAWRRLPRPVLVAAGLVIAAILVQTIPVPRAVLAAVSPAALPLLAQYDLSFAARGAAALHPLSIDPGRTWTGLMLAVSLGLFWLGLTASLSDRATIRIVRALAALGVVLAAVALADLAAHTPRIYGVWQPQGRGAPFGPFVNRNHFAGWMLMTIPLAIGYLIAILSGEARRRVRSWRDRVVWCASPEASGLVLLAVAVTVMTLSVFLSLSRSGISCLIIVLAALGWGAARRLATGTRRALAVAALAVVTVGCVGWAGVDRIGSRFEEFHGDLMAGRSIVWHDARRIAAAFPLAGTGVDTFGSAMLFYQTGDLQEWYAEAHSDYLQIVAEGGLLVAVPVLVLVVVTVGEVRRRFRETAAGSTIAWVRAGAVAGLLAVALQETVDFSLQMPGNAALFCVLAAIALRRADPVPADRGRASIPARSASPPSAG